MKKDDAIFNIFIVGIILLIFVGIVFFAINTRTNNPAELTQGEPLTDYCKKKCKNNKVLTSNYNNQYEFIRCKCLLEVQIGATHVRAQTKTMTAIYFFDSNSNQEISKKQAIERINKII